MTLSKSKLRVSLISELLALVGLSYVALSYLDLLD